MPLRLIIILKPHPPRRHKRHLPLALRRARRHGKVDLAGLAVLYRDGHGLRALLVRLGGLGGRERVREGRFDVGRRGDVGDLLGYLDLDASEFLAYGDRRLLYAKVSIAEDRSK